MKTWTLFQVTQPKTVLRRYKQKINIRGQQIITKLGWVWKDSYFKSLSFKRYTLKNYRYVYNASKYSGTEITKAV